jgi:serine/threonine protein kinase
MAVPTSPRTCAIPHSTVTASRGRIIHPTSGMALAAGSRLDAYELVRPLGAGGMGEVWLATDVRLGRKVAVKLLPQDLTRDPARVLRFEQEARAASALNHPNVCTILALGDTAGGQHYIAMEYVEGQTLRQRLSSSRLSLRESLDIVIQIASALSAAHHAGIIHRDIKPENVMLRPDGLVKVLDFGLAKLAEPRSSDPDSETRALEPALTEPGVVVGTAAYMSPEQARAESVDARTDLFSLGAVMYEMVTGRRAFTRAFDWTPPAADELPSALRPVVRKLLAPDVAARYQAAGNALQDLERVRRRGRTGSKRVPPGAWLAGAAVLIVAMIVMAAMWASTKSRPATVSNEWVRLTNLPDSASQPALSRDGRMLAFIRGPDTFVTSGDVYVKALPDGDPVQLTRDSTSKMSPVFSPDGLRIAYTVSSGGEWNTWILPVIGGQAHLWLENVSGLAWLDKNRVLFSEVKDGDIHMAIVAADENRGNAHDVYVPVSSRGMAHRSYPSPDGRWALVAEMDRARWLSCRLVPLSGNSAGRPVGPSDGGCTSAAWTPDSKWMFLNANVNGAFHVWRQRFPDGELEQVTSGLTEEEGLAIDPDGRSFLTSVGQRQSVVWLRQQDTERQISLEGYSYDAKFTPDAKRLCYRILKGTVPVSDPSELRIVDLETGRNEALLPGLALSNYPGRAYDISPDGQWVVAPTADKDGHWQVWLARLDRRVPPHTMPRVSGDVALFAGDRTIVFRVVQGSSAFVYRAALDGTGLARVSDLVIAGIVGVSPDGQWVLARTPDRSLRAIPLGGGASLPVLVGVISGDVHVAWAQNKISISLPAAAGSLMSGLRGKTFVIPLTRGQVFPPMPEGGFRSEAELVAIPGATLMEGYDVTIGPTPGTYAYSRQSVQRNVYRIPIP